MSTAPLRTLRGLSLLRAPAAARTLTTTARRAEAAKPSPTAKAPADLEADPAALGQQAPNRIDVWARGQQHRTKAMSGPRFEQTEGTLQPQPSAAIELIHQQPVRWTHSRVVSCDGGGGPAGHPRIFINTDKPEIATCGYCGLPFAHEHHRKHLESLPQTSYPLQ